MGMPSSTWKDWPITKGRPLAHLARPPAASQEMFENQLALQLYQNKDKMIWMEDESQRIGKLTIPHALWQTMRQKPVYFLDIPFEERLAYLLQTYSGFEKEKYVNAVIRIQKRLGPLETRNTIGFYWKTIIPAPSRILLAYYDKTYKNRCITGKDSKPAAYHSLFRLRRKQHPE